MSDVIFVGLFFGFIATCVAYVAMCERVVEDDDSADTEARPR